MVDDEFEQADDEIELVADGDGLAVIGPAGAVERFLRSQGLWELSQSFDLERMRSLLGKGADLAQTASEIAADSARWLKLTPESAHLRAQYGLMETKTPGISHAMVGKPGAIESWLQAETGARSLLTNPAVLSGVAGIMAQASIQQSIAEITEYLATIDEKVDDLLRKQDDAVIAQLVGLGSAIERALTIRDETGSVNNDVWSTVDQAPQIIGATQSYALDQLDAIAQKLENPRVGALAKTVERAKSEVPGWLAVLARCFQLQEATDMLQIDRVMADTPDELVAHRRGLDTHREERRGLIAEHTAHLLDRIEAAVGTANARMIWNRTKSLEVVGSANRLAAGLNDFHERVGVESDDRTWEARQLGRAADLSSQAIQKTKDDGPKVAAAAVVLVAVKTVQNALGGEGTDGDDGFRE